MSRLAQAAAAVAALAAALLVCGCSRGAQHAQVKLPRIGPATDFDQARLEAGVDARFGGVGTCVIVADARSGRELYRYNTNGVCMNLLPPCETFDIPNALIGLDAGAITPQTVFRWDKSPQPIRAWERDADLAAAFKGQLGWWFQRLARQLGPAAYQAGLEHFDYGNKAPQGPIISFWQGPSQGGRLGLSTRQQAQFLHRLFGGDLPAQPQSRAVVTGLMADETRGGETLWDRFGGCGANSDGSEQVAWWIGRIAGPRHDYVFAASLLTPSDTALPGRELQLRGKAVFAQAGLWPAG